MYLISFSFEREIFYTTFKSNLPRSLEIAIIFGSWFQLSSSFIISFWSWMKRFSCIENMKWRCSMFVVVLFLFFRKWKKNAIFVCITSLFSLSVDHCVHIYKTGSQKTVNQKECKRRVKRPKRFSCSLLAHIYLLFYFVHLHIASNVHPEKKN